MATLLQESARVAQSKRKTGSKTSPTITRADLYEAIRTSEHEGMDFLEGGKLLDLSLGTIFKGTNEGIVYECEEEEEKEEGD